MSKVIFVGDLHLSNQAPISRKEDNEQWRELQINKLKFIYDYAEVYGISNIIFAGDIFNSSSIDSISGQHLINIVNQFLRVKSYSIIGNHDMFYRNENLFDYTILGLMFKTKTLTHLDRLLVDEVLIQGTDYLQDIPKLDTNVLTKPDYSICVAHQFYENSEWGTERNSNLTNLEAINKGYNAYLLGHDHSYYEPMNISSNCLLLRPRFFI